VNRGFFLFVYACFKIDLFSISSSKKDIQGTQVIAYKKDLAQFFIFIQQNYSLNHPGDITYAMIRLWIVELMNNKIAPRSINRKLSTLKTYFNFLLKENLISVNPMGKIILPRISRKLPFFIEKDKMDMLFSRIDFGEGFEHYVTG